LITQRPYLFALLLLGGCSLTLKADQKACKKNDDCGVPLECRQGLCLAKTDCKADAECQSLGSKYASSICVDSTCSLPQCEGADECQGGDTPNYTCVQGRCQDPVWGCLGQPDNRVIMGETATFKVRVVSLISEAALPDLKIEACAAVDTLCQAPLREPVITYKDALVTVAGLPQDTPIHLKFEAADHITTDFYSQRLVRNETVEEIIELVPTVLFGALGASLGVDVDVENKASINVLTLDCNEEPQPGIQLLISDTLDTTEIYYVNAGNTPDTKLDRTTVAGAAGAVNLAPGKQITVKVVLGERVISSFPVTPYANRMTYVDLYPRSY
jgi:hypothetical protein